MKMSRTSVKISLTISVLFAIATVGNSAQAGWFTRSKPVQPAPAVKAAQVPVAGSAQAIAGKMQVEYGKQRLGQVGGFLKGAIGMKVRAIGYKIEGNKQEANRMEFGAKAKFGAVERRVKDGSGSYLAGIANQGAGAVRAAVAPGVSSGKSVIASIKNSNAAATVEIGTKAGVHWLKGAFQAVVAVPGALKAKASAASAAAKANIVNAAAAEGLSQNAQGRLLAQ
jgi:hypothetical protein